MKLLDVYNQLAYGELRSMFYGTGPLDGGNIEMPDAVVTRLTPLIKLGLTELHKRFPLREATEEVTLVDGTLTYVIAPTADDLMRVERIYGIYLEKPYEIPLNEIDNVASIRTTSQTVLLIPDDVEDAPWLDETTTLEVIYRADHVPILEAQTATALKAVDVNIPLTHMEPLIWYVCSRILNPGGIHDEFHEGNNYAQKFEAACALLKRDGFRVEANSENTKLMDRGFV